MMIVYKLLRQRKDGSLGPLFISPRQRIPLGVWNIAENIPTKGYSERPGWHSAIAPFAPHLTENGRVWTECEISDAIEYTIEKHPHLFEKDGDMGVVPENGFYVWKRPNNQGSNWIISGELKVNRILTQEELITIRKEASRFVLS